MSSSSIGAQNVQKQDFSCQIDMVVCHYTKDKESKMAVFYARNSTNGGNSSSQKEFYFITNHKGEGIDVRCNRITNNCTDANHHKFILEHIDIKSKEKRTATREIDKGKIKLYYYDLFYRGGEYSDAAKNYTDQKLSNKSSLVQGGVGLVASGAGKVAGSIADFVAAMRFIILPRIKPGDAKYACLTSITYKQCPNKKSVPKIIINSYPDIEYSLTLGFAAGKMEYNKTQYDKGQKSQVDKSSSTSFSFKFDVSYATETHELKFEKGSEKELQDEESRKGAAFYKTMDTIADFFEKSSKFTQKVKEFFGSGSAAGSAVSAVKDSNGSFLRSYCNWLSSSFEFKPSITGIWRYSVSENLSKLGRYIQLKFQCECTGELRVDLIALAAEISKKSAQGAAVTATVGTCGAGGLVAIFLSKLAGSVVDWLRKKIEEGLSFDFVLKGTVTLKACDLTWDTSRDTVFEGKGLTLEVKPEVRLELNAEFSTSKSWNLKIVKITAKGEVKAYAEASISVTFQFFLNIEDGMLGLARKGFVNPFTLELGYKVAGSFSMKETKTDSQNAKGVQESSKSKTEKSYENEYKYEMKQIDFDLGRSDWFKICDSTNSSGGSFGGGGGGKSW